MESICVVAAFFAFCEENPWKHFNFSMHEDLCYSSNIFCKLMTILPGREIKKSFDDGTKDYIQCC